MQPLAIIEIELKSESVFGGDGEQLGTVDLDIQCDEYGIPYYAGRTLKGVLREQAEWYLNLLPEPEKRETQKALERLFGIPDERGAGIQNQNYHSLRIGDAKISESIRKTIINKVQNNKVHPREILNAFTTVRSMTKINHVTGVAEDKSLRQVRVIKPRFTFYAPVYVQGKLTNVEKQLFENSVKLLRQIGIMRNRGKGAVTCKLHWNDENRNISTNQVGLDKESNYLLLRIDIEEPIKISHVLGTSDSSQALNYIPGSVLRGALIHRYLQDNGLSEEEIDTSEIFNHEFVQFWNGYLMVQEKRGLPFVQHLFEPKANSKTEMKRRKLYNSLNEQINKIRNASPVKVSRHVMILDDEEKVLKTRNVRLNSSLHMSVNGNRANDDNVTQLYRYEAIAPNQTFQSVVMAKGESDFVKWLQNQTELTLWLGGARNSGYGRVKIVINRTNAHPEQPKEISIDKAKELYIIATSDWLLQNRRGQWVSAIDHKWLEEQLGAKLSLMNQVVNVRQSGGYISKWQAYQPMINGVQAGSIFRYEIKENRNLNEETIAKLVEKGVGARRNEGYGRLIVLTDWEYEHLVDIKTTPQIVEQLQNNFSEKEERELAFIQRAFNEEKLIDLIRDRVNSWMESITGRNHISNSQWGILLQITSELLSLPLANQTLEAFQAKWEKFWKDNKERLDNKSTLSFEGVRVAGIKIEQFIMKQLEEKWEVEQLFVKTDIVHHHWNMRAIELLLRQVIRTNNKSEKGVHV